jgi:hypothetical protein
MKNLIEVKLHNDTNPKSTVYTVILDGEELAEVIRKGGQEAGNKAIDLFVARFTEQFKAKLGQYLTS